MISIKQKDMGSENVLYDWRERKHFNVFLDEPFRLNWSYSQLAGKDLLFELRDPTFTFASFFICIISILSFLLRCEVSSSVENMRSFAGFTGETAQTNFVSPLPFWESFWQRIFTAKLYVHLYVSFENVSCGCNTQEERS